MHGSSNSLEERLAQELDSLRAQNRYRSLKPATGIDFTSNDYLGYAMDHDLRSAAAKQLKKLPLSSTGSRLLRGNHPMHVEAEERFANFASAPSALLFNSGYDANYTLMTTLPSRLDAILYDEYSHASLREGIAASHATKKGFEHNNIGEVIPTLSKRSSYRNIFVVVESLYSMDGDEAPLTDLADMCRKYDATLIVDEAHATGLYGRNGSGLVDHYGLAKRVSIRMHTCGKALGTHGAFVCASETVKEYLVNKSRGLIFTTALPPVVPATIVSVLDRLEQGEDRRKVVLESANKVRKQLQSDLKRWKVPDGNSPIVPVIIGGDSEAIEAAEILQKKNLDVRAIRPPSVPEGTSRLRITINYLHKQRDLDRLTEALVKAENHLSKSQNP